MWTKTIAVTVAALMLWSCDAPQEPYSRHIPDPPGTVYTPFTRPFANTAYVTLNVWDLHLDRLRDSRRLNDAQSRRFESALRYVHIPPDAEHVVAGCFVPHHFFRYYDAQDRLLGEVAVCFCCLGVAAYNAPPDNSRVSEVPMDADYNVIAKIVKEVGEEPEMGCGGV